MENIAEKAYQAFDMFKKGALVAAGNEAHHNACTIGWGSMGTIWRAKQTITVYLHPARYTTEFLKDNDLFTVSFYPEECKQALRVMGSLSGRDGDKEKTAGLTPVAIDGTITFEEAEVTFVCRKLYEGRFLKEGLHDDVKTMYAASPKTFPPDENGEWQPHDMFIGEVIDVLEK